jgi:hypothetical protein
MGLSLAAALLELLFFSDLDSLLLSSLDSLLDSVLVSDLVSPPPPPEDDVAGAGVLTAELAAAVVAEEVAADVAALVAACVAAAVACAVACATACVTTIVVACCAAGHGVLFTIVIQAVRAPEVMSLAVTTFDIPLYTIVTVPLFRGTVTVNTLPEQGSTYTCVNTCPSAKKLAPTRNRINKSLFII